MFQATNQQLFVARNLQRLWKYFLVELYYTCMVIQKSVVFNEFAMESGSPDEFDFLNDLPNFKEKSLELPSGKLTVCYWKWPFLVDLPIKKGDLP